MTELWEDAEIESNKLLGLKATKGSGGTYSETDGLSEQFAHEVKYRTGATFAIPSKDWKKLKEQSRRLNKTPIFTTARVIDDNLTLISSMATKDLGRLIGTNISIDEKKIRIALILDYFEKVIKGNIDSTRQMNTIVCKHREWLENNNLY